MESTKEKKKSLGKLVSINMDVDKPMDWHSSIDFSRAVEGKEPIPTSLSVFIGKNGSGKTLILKLSFALGNIANGIALGAPNKTGFAQYIMDNTFDDQNFNGTMGATYSCGADLTLTIKDGHVEKVDFQGFEDKQPVKVIFLSSGMRLFTNIQLYLKMRKMSGKEGIEDVMQEMLKHFKLYDVAYIEALIHNMPYKMEPNIQQFLDAFSDSDMGVISEVNIDWDKPDFYMLSDKYEGKKYLTTFGNGHQAILNMGLSNLLR